MASIKANYDLIRAMLQDGWSGDEFQGSKQICASLLRCSYTYIRLDYDWQRIWFADRDFEHLWMQLMNDVRDEFVSLCLDEMEQE